MGNRFLNRNSVAALLVVACAVFPGCAVLSQRPPPLTVEQVVALSKAGTPAEAVIRQLRESRTVLALSGSQYAKLRSDGVADEVLDYLQHSYVSAVEFDTRMRYQGMYYGWGPIYPHRPFPGPFPYGRYW
ncbi:MAG: hypothetical protein U1F52_08340 [Burkholderiales bacterium]